MRHRHLRWVGGAALALFTAFVVLQAEQSGPGQSQPPTPRGEAPRLVGGMPDFNGLWGMGVNFELKPDEQGNLNLQIGRLVRDASLTNLERDSGLMQRANPNRPHYRPDWWARVQYYDDNGNTEDPAFLCFPEGVPRMGPPQKIVHTATEMIFLYSQYSQANDFRIIYLDGRQHPPKEKWEGRWYGHSVGRWEGDTLVIDSVDFTDASWLGWPGWVHSYNMRVEERMRREGDMLHWQATVYDPDALLKPWTTDPVDRRVNSAPEAELPEELPCSERDSRHIVTKERG